MPSLETFIIKLTRKKPEEVGSVQFEELDPGELIATRPSLTHERLDNPKHRRSSSLHPDVVHVEGTDRRYVVDGHHKSRRAHESGCGCIPCRVLTTNNRVVVQAITRRGSVKVKNLPIQQG